MAAPTRPTAMRALLTPQRLRALSGLATSTTSSSHTPPSMRHSSSGSSRPLCTKPGGSDNGAVPPAPPSREGLLARLLAPREGKRNPLLAALGYYSAESRSIGAGNVLYKQALSRASVAAETEDRGEGNNDFSPRFEMLSVHVYLTLGRLRAEKGSPYEAEVKTIMQCLFDVFWTDVRSRMLVEERGMKLIESGKWIKECEQRFFGMSLAFDETWENQDKFRDAIRRNITCLQSDDIRVERFRRYMVTERSRLDKATVGQICEGVCWDEKYPSIQSL